MQKFIAFNKNLSNFLWGIPMIVVLIFGGLFLLYRSNFWVFRNLGYIFKSTFGRLISKKDGSSSEAISPFQAVSTALAGTIGAGNIVGVATAIEFGGPGAIFWMWLAALISMTTKMAEVTFAVATRLKNSDGTYIGGPMYYIERGAKSKLLAKLFAFFAFIAIIGTGALVQANSISESINSLTGINLRLIGAVIVIFMLLVVVGGIKRIASFAEKIVPFMSVFYVMCCLLILFLQRQQIIPAFQAIISGAFGASSMASGISISTILLAIRWGLARGIFSNEAGLGTAPMAHAASHTDHPIRQGMWGAIEVFVSSMIICTMTALVILSSGLWHDPNFSGASLTTASFSTVFVLGKYLVTTALVLFAFTTAVSWCYYGERCVQYLTGSSKIANIFKYVYIICCYVGSIGGLKFAWGVADTANALMVIPNIVAILIMSKSFKRILDDFLQHKNTKSNSYNLTYENKWHTFFDAK